MANNIYPLIYKPGIKRDGTLFQSDYCTDAQWIRFQRGFIRKMGGMKGVSVQNMANLITQPKSVVLLPTSDNNIMVYVGGSHDLASDGIYIQRYVINQQFELIENTTKALLSHFQINDVWQNEIIIQGSTNIIVYLISPSYMDINDNSTCTLYFANILTPRLVQGIGFSALTKPPILTGLSGLLFASNYLFVYGSNGLVQWSKPNDPLDFTNSADRQIIISNDKVIHARSIRGGINNPAILFWTMSSVVRCINNPIAGTPPDTLAFAIDVLSKSSSIMSSRCVVEYDGDFYWPGLNRFFQYKGTVRKLPNALNQNYFFNNIDLQFRQSVFGVKHPQYDEIWWFYPEKLGTPGRPTVVPPGEPTRALIYNVLDETWNDTAISRTCGTYSDALGVMVSYGRPLTNLSSSIKYLFRHEYETFNSAPQSINEIFRPVLSDPAVVNNPITSNFTTPTVSWAAFNAMKQLTGVNRWIYLITLEPDFTLMPTRAQGGSDMTVTINTKQYAQDFPASSPAYPVPVPLTNDQDSSLAKIDTAWQGRYITLTFTTTTNFEMGQVMLQIGIGDGQ